MSSSVQNSHFTVQGTGYRVSSPPYLGSCPACCPSSGSPGSWRSPTCGAAASQGYTCMPCKCTLLAGFGGLAALSAPALRTLISNTLKGRCAHPHPSQLPCSTVFEDTHAHGPFIRKRFYSQIYHCLREEKFMYKIQDLYSFYDIFELRKKF